MILFRVGSTLSSRYFITLHLPSNVGEGRTQAQEFWLEKLWSLFIAVSRLSMLSITHFFGAMLPIIPDWVCLTLLGAMLPIIPEWVCLTLLGAMLPIIPD